MPKFDPNLTAAKVLRQALRRHAAAESAWHAEYRKAWRDAAAVIRATPPGKRLRDKKLSVDQLQRLGELPIIDS